MSDWNEFSVMELQKSGALLVEDGNHGNNRPRRDEFLGNGVKFIRAADLDGGVVLFEQAQSINSVAVERIRKGIGKDGDIILSHKGTVGKVAFVPEHSPEFVCSPQTTFWRVLDNSQLERRYLYSFLCSWYFKTQLLGRQNESDMAGYVSLTSQRSLRIRLPTVNEQRAIGGALGSLDDKITLNRKLNETLEGMAQALFQSWFVDFDPVKAELAAKRHGRDPEHACMAALSGKLRIPPGKPRAECLHDQLPTADELDAAIAALDTLTETQHQQLTQTASYFPDDFQDSDLDLIPVAWEVKPFSEIFEINPRRILKKNAVAPYLDMKSVPTSGPSPEGIIRREFKSGTKFINGDTLLARITPCLENGKTAFVDFLKDDEVGWGSTEFIIIRPKNINPAIGYFYARSDELRAHAITNMSGTSGRQRVPADCFDNFLIPSPDNSFLYEAFGQTAQVVLDSIRLNSNQSRTLAELRDTLLPKLLSGELSVNTAEDAVEAVAP